MKKTGFAALPPERQRELARKGGIAAHEKGVAHKFTREEAQIAGRKGGAAHSREHMREIGRKGGLASGRKRNVTEELDEQ